MKCDDSLAILTKEKEDMENDIKVIGKISSSQDSVVVDADGIAPTHTSGHGNCPKIAEPMIVGYSRCEKGKVVGRHLKETANTITAATSGTTAQYVALPYIAAVRGREPNVLTPRRTEYGKAVRREYERGDIREPRKNMQRFEPRTDGISNTLTSVSKDNYLVEPGVKKHPKYRIRKLTPRECFRLMDVDDADIDKIQGAGICNSQQYKLAGNSIVVNVLYHIFRKMFVEQGNEEQQLKLF